MNKLSEIIFKTTISKGARGEQGEQGVSYEVPTNSIVAYDGNDTPTGWIECDAPEGFPAIAMALGGVGKAGDVTLTEITTGYRQKTLILGGAESLANQIAEELGASVAPLPNTSNYTSCYLLYMTPKDLEYKTGLFVGSYESGSYLQDSVYRYINGELKTDAGLLNASSSIQTALLNSVKTSDSWICGARTNESANLTMGVAWSRAKYLDDETQETSVYSILSGQRIYTWCDMIDEQGEQKELISIVDDKLALAPLVAERSRVKANNLYIITAMTNTNAQNKAFTFELDNDTYSTSTTAYVNYRRLATITERGQ